MWIERLDDLRSLALAPTIVLAAVADVIGEDLDDVLDWPKDPIDVAIGRLQGLARRDARLEANETDGSPDGTWSTEKHNRMAALWHHHTDGVCDLVNLALDRLRGEGEFESESEDGMATATAKRATKSRAVKSAGDGPPAGLCILCGTAIAVGVDACPACGGRDRRSMVNDPLPSSLGPLNGEVRPAAAPVSDQLRQIAVDHVVPSPYQRRKTFDEAALEQLSASIVEHGLLHPIVVRPKPDCPGVYELIAGERRLRATKLAGYTTIAATVRDLTDAQAAEACATENLDRQDLNAIEEAETLKVLLDVGGLTQDQLGQRINRSQPWIANRLRLLELPDDWQARIISQEMPPTHARELLAWKHRPAVLKKAAKEVADARKEDRPWPSVDHFRSGLRRIAFDVTKPLTGWECAFKPTKAQRSELDIEMIESPWGGVGERCWNTKLWHKLNKEAKAKEQADAKAAAAKPAADAGRKNPGPPADWSIRNRVTPWLAREITARLKKTDRDNTLRLLLLMATGVIECTFTDFESSHPLFKRDWHNRVEAGVRAWRTMIEMTPAQLAGLAHELVTSELNDEGIDEGSAETLVEILAALGGDPLAYPLSAEDLDLYGVALLRDMAGTQIDAKASKADCITCLLADRFPGWLPAEYAAILTPQSARKTSKRKAKPR